MQGRIEAAFSFAFRRGFVPSSKTASQAREDSILNPSPVHRWRRGLRLQVARRPVQVLRGWLSKNGQRTVKERNFQNLRATGHFQTGKNQLPSFPRLFLQLMKRRLLRKTARVPQYSGEGWPLGGDSMLWKSVPVGCDALLGFIVEIS